MPTYAYTCRDCGRATEAVQAFTDPSLTVCPHCGGRLRKQYGTVGVTFNGSGFYRTDSRAPQGDGAAKTEAGSKGDGGSKSDGGGKSDGAKSDGGAKSDSSPAKPAAAPSAGSGSAG